MDNYLSEKGLPGLSAVRNRLGLTQASVAKSSDCTSDFIRFIETGRKDCSQDIQRKLAELLCCKVADLFEKPDAERLREIEIAYKRRELEQLEAGEQKGVA